MEDVRSGPTIFLDSEHSAGMGVPRKTPTTEVVPKDPSTVGRKGIRSVTPPHTCKTHRHPPLVYHPVCQTVPDPV